jgi:hypothetical protein
MAFGRGERVQGQRTIPGVAQGDPGSLHELGRVGPRGQRVLVGREVVNRDHLGAVAAAVGAQGLEPGGDPSVELTAPATRDLVVGDIPHEDMAKRELRLALDGRVAHGRQELLPNEIAESCVHPSSGATLDLGEDSGPDDLADDRRVLKQRLVLGRQGVDSRGDHSVHRLRGRPVLR